PTPLCPPVRWGQLREYHAATARMLRTIGARLVLTDRRLHSVLGQTIESAGLDLGCHTAEVLESERDPELDERARADQIGLIQFSSGSTTEAKAVALSHGQLMAQCAALTTLMPAQDETTHVGASWLPLYHDMGLIGCLLTAVYYGRSKLVLIPAEHFSARPRLWLRAVSRHRALVSPAPNFAYRMCLQPGRDQEMVGADAPCWPYG